MALGVAACNKDKEDPDKYIVDALTFGTYYPDCDSGCVTMYEVRPTTVARDDSAKMKDLLAWGYTFTNVVVLTAARTPVATPLLTSVPRELFKGSTVVLGSPGAKGGMYLRIMTIPGIYLYKIDLNDSPDQSEEVRAFKRKVLETMGNLK